jgi:hypothetical protein
MKPTLQVVPFLVLAVGVDNIYILVQALQKDPPKSVSNVPQQVSLLFKESTQNVLTYYHDNKYPNVFIIVLNLNKNNLTHIIPLPDLDSIRSDRTEHAPLSML